MGGNRHAKDVQRELLASPRGLSTQDQRQGDPRRDRFDPTLDGPKINILPTLMQVFPDNWVNGHDSPCYIMIGNWLDATENDFVTENNIQLVMRVTGTHPYKGDTPPAGNYGHNNYTGCQPKVEQCPINHRSIVFKKWLDMCDACIRIWKNARRGEPPPPVCIHCNEGINRAPAWAGLLVSKLQGCQPAAAARELAAVRAINPMYSLGKPEARGQDLTTWSLMHVVEDVSPLRVHNLEHFQKDTSKQGWQPG